MKTSRYNFFKSACLALLFFGCTQYPMNGSMRGWGHMMGYGNNGGIFMWLIWIIILGVIVYFIFNRSEITGKRGDPATERPEDIIKRRYAKGEISKEEFERLKKDIES